MRWLSCSRAWLVALSVGGASACATTPSTPPPVAVVAPPPAPVLAPHVIAFPPSTFTGDVLATGTPIVTAAEGAVFVSVPFGTKAPAQCVLSRRSLDAGGSLEVLLARTFLGARLRERAVDTLDVSPDTGLMLLTVRRDDLTPVKVAAYRDRARSLVCAHDGAADAGPFQQVAASLVAQVRAPSDDPPPDVTELCALKVGDGSLGFERVELFGTGLDATTRVTTLVAFRDGPTSVDLMESSSEEHETKGRISALSLVRFFGGRLDLRAALTRAADGGHRAVVTGRRGQRYDGALRVADDEGLLGPSGTRALVRRTLLEGPAAETRVETFDPLASPEKTQVKVFARTERPGDLVVTDGPIVTRQTVDSDGFLRRAQTTLPTGSVLEVTCRRAEASVARTEAGAPATPTGPASSPEPR